LQPTTEDTEKSLNPDFKRSFVLFLCEAYFEKKANEFFRLPDISLFTGSQTSGLSQLG
jgi:hypothetical protein